MRDYAELVKALRCCSKIDARNNGCDSCPYEYCGEDCQNLCGYAADAIEELLDAIADITKTVSVRDVTDAEIGAAKMVLSVVENLDHPMLMYGIEKSAVKKALILMLRICEAEPPKEVQDG